MYDSNVGRWLSRDPKRQYYSPYVGMGNDPINGTDPDGAAWFRNTTMGKSHGILLMVQDSVI